MTDRVPPDISLMAAAINSREAFEAIRTSGETGAFQGSADLLWQTLTDYYSKDSCSRADPALLRELTVAKIVSPKKQKQAIEYLETCAGFPVSLPNVASYLEIAARSRLGNELAGAIAMRRPQQDIDKLMAEYQAIAVRFGEKVEETLPDWAGILKRRAGREGGLFISPSSLNKALGGGLLPGHNLTIFGRPECIAGDTVLRIRTSPDTNAAKSLTIEALYARVNGKHGNKGSGPYMIQAVDAGGRVAYRRIVAVLAAGIKPVFEVTTARGFSIIAAGEHKFRLAGGGYKTLDELDLDDEILTDRTDRQEALKREERSGRWPEAPYATRMVGQYGPYHRVPLHRLAYDAALNGYTVEGFEERLSKGGDDVLDFAPRELDVHHKDGDHENNSPDNMVLLTRAEHSAIHADQGDTGNGRHADPDAVISISPCGEEECYDLCVEGPIHNYRAAGIYVHNSGKTAVAINAAVGFARKGVRTLYVGNEDPIEDLALRAMCCITGKTGDVLLQDPTAATEEATSLGLNNLVMRDISPGTLEEVERMVRLYEPQVLVVDQLRNLLGGRSDNYTQHLDRMAQGVRALGKKYGLVTISVTQAGDSARGKPVLHDGDIDSSNTGIPGAADVLVGVAVTDDMERAGIRNLCIAKNKLTGDHSVLPVRIYPALSRIRS